MLHIKVNADDNLVTVSPDGKLSSKDFETLRATIDDYINAQDAVPSLIIKADKFPHYEHFKDFFSHFKFIRGIEKIVPKVALVTDSRMLKFLPEFSNHFAEAKIRYFPYKNLKRARAWAISTGDHPGEIVILDDLPNDVVGLEYKGVITRQDYEDNLVPLIEKKLQRHDKLKFLVVIGDDFQSSTAGAAWDDQKFGMHYMGQISKLAVVSDRAWIRSGVKLFGPFTHAKVKTFYLDQISDAREWVKE